jgi:hypothetical protein
MLINARNHPRKLANASEALDIVCKYHWIFLLLVDCHSSRRVSYAIAESVPEMKLDPSQRISSAIRKPQNPSARVYHPSHRALMNIPEINDLLRPSTSEKYHVGISNNTTEIAKQD